MPTNEKSLKNCSKLPHFTIVNASDLDKNDYISSVVIKISKILDLMAMLDSQMLVQVILLLSLSIDIFSHQSLLLLYYKQW